MDIYKSMLMDLQQKILGPVVLLVASLSADPGSDLDLCYAPYCREIDHEIFFLSRSPPASCFKKVCFKLQANHVLEVLGNRLVKLSQEKKCG